MNTKPKPPPRLYVRRALAPGDPDRAARWGSSGGRCECTTGQWGDPSSGRCPANAEDVFLLSDGNHIAMCKRCRIAGSGLTPKERKELRNANKAAQQPMFEPQWTGTLEHKPWGWR
jgi:hypothetical protein